MRNLLLSLIGAGALLCSCSEEEVPVVYPNDGNLSVTASIHSNLNKFAFVNNSELGLYVTENETGEWYKTNPYSNVLARAAGVGEITWVLETPIALGDEPAMVFAYYPYNYEVRNPYNIPVLIDRDDLDMVDYMYGSTKQTQKVTRSEPMAELVMQHALAMIQFDLSIDPNQPYYGTGIITEAKIIAMDAAGNLIQNKSIIQQGYMDCVNGDITGTAWGSVRIPDLKGKDFHGRFNGSYPAVLVAPAYDMEHTAFMINVDGKEFFVPLPKGTTWAKNTKNRYNLVLSGMEIRIDDESMVVEDWNEGLYEFGEFNF